MFLIIHTIWLYSCVAYGITSIYHSVDGVTIDGVFIEAFLRYLVYIVNINLTKRIDCWQDNNREQLKN